MLFKEQSQEPENGKNHGGIGKGFDGIG